MSRAALFFDIDGTLLSEITGQVPESTREALALARAQGHLVFVNTGRTYGELGKIRTLVEPDGWLCGCGTYIQAEGRVLVHQIMTPEEIGRISQKARVCDVDCFLEGMGGCFVLTEDTRYPMGRRLRTNPDFPVRYWREDEPAGDIEKFCVIADDQSWREEFFASLGPGIQVIDRGGDFFECVPAGFSKATAIDRILEEYGLSLEDAYVFGDSTNDISMFHHVPNAVLMGKHDRELEPYASFVTRTVEEDEIRYAMEQLGLIPGEDTAGLQNGLSREPVGQNRSDGTRKGTPEAAGQNHSGSTGKNVREAVGQEDGAGIAKFPLFYNLQDRKVLVAGAGTVGTRRAEMLAEFGARVLVAAPQGTGRMEELAVTGKVTWEHRPFLPQDLEGCFLVVAATDDAGTNDWIARLCREQKLLVNHAGDQSQCDVYFPGIAKKGSLVAGITASGTDHGLTKEMTRKVQELLERSRNLAGYILAGGDNRRMEGRKKLYLQREGKTFCQWICEAFADLPGIYLSVAELPADNGHQKTAAEPPSQRCMNQSFAVQDGSSQDSGLSEILEKGDKEAGSMDSGLDPYGRKLPEICDRYGHIGPLGGIASGLSQCKEDALFVAACDMPFISREAVRTIAEAFEKKPVLTIARSGDRLHPLFGIYPRTILPVLERQIRNQDYRMMHLLEQVEYEAIDFGDDSPELGNINTREQYEQIEEAGQTEDSGRAGGPGQPEDSGRADQPGQTENSGRAGEPGQPEASGSTGCPSQRTPGRKPFIFAVSGYKNSGKTTLITRLLPVLVSRGYRVAVIKHDGHDFESDVPGTDSYRHQKAGAYGTAVFSGKRMMLTKEIQGVDETRLSAAFPEADIILIEGLKNSPYPKYFCNYPQEEPLSPEELADKIVKAMEEP